MPAIFDRCVKDLTPKYGKDRAYAVCTKSFMSRYGMTPAAAAKNPKAFAAAQAKAKGKDKK